jgi:predicted RNA-binding protein
MSIGQDASSIVGAMVDLVPYHSHFKRTINRHPSLSRAGMDKPIRGLHLAAGLSTMAGLKSIVSIRPGNRQPDAQKHHQGRMTMCDVNVFILNNGVEEKVLENVDLIEEVAEGMHLVNIFGEERTLKARMVHYNNGEKRMVFQPV